GGARHGALLQARAELVAARHRVHALQRLADGAADEVHRGLRAVLVPAGLHDTDLGALALERVAGVDPEVADHRPHLVGLALDHQPALVAVALDARAVDLGQHRAAGGRRRLRRTLRAEAFRVVRIRRLRARIRDGVAV